MKIDKSYQTIYYLWGIRSLLWSCAVPHYGFSIFPAGSVRFYINIEELAVKLTNKWFAI